MCDDVSEEVTGINNGLDEVRKCRIVGDELVCVSVRGLPSCERVRLNCERLTVCALVW